MKKGKLSLFVVALTLSVGLSSGVYAAQQNKDSKCVKPTTVAQKIDFKTTKTEQWNAKFVKNHMDNTKLSDSKVASKIAKDKVWAEKYTKNHMSKVESKDIKVTLTAEQKEVIQAQKDKIATVKDANKVLKTAIITNAEAVKVELKRIEDNKLVLDPAVKTEADAVLLAVKDATTKKDCVKPEVTPVTPVVPVVDPTVPVVPAVPVEKTYFEKLNERLDNAFQKYTVKNTELTTLAARLLTLLNSLTLIK
ncbi:MAG TPA: hypothetical protein VIM70_02075 [Clostridium sp.]|uniref:hypothetical protein n=1 Tax=Clostridium sp. TaxID=1506 RepID=UPI002F929F1C